MMSGPVVDAVKWMRYLAAGIQESRPRMADETRRIADALELHEQIRASLRDVDTCRRCGGQLVNASTGRPRKFCRECRPPETRRKLSSAGG